MSICVYAVFFSADYTFVFKYIDIVLSAFLLFVVVVVVAAVSLFCLFVLFVFFVLFCFVLFFC